MEVRPEAAPAAVVLVVVALAVASMVAPVADDPKANPSRGPAISSFSMGDASTEATVDSLTTSYYRRQPAPHKHPPVGQGNALKWTES